MDPVPIRAHNLLCLLGYRGRGYDDAFVERMTDVHRTLTADPGTPVQVLVRPDRLCDACPHLRTDGCSLGGRGHEAHMRAQDLDVVRRLGLEEGQVLPWREILERVARHVRGSDLPTICTTCPWLGLGWCAEGVERVRADRQETAPP
ncbi:MAG: DUF1284 domain-containing protein [Planctomycetia bacterium]|nr:DUF1284 domain-containing protein [Planctomycetia bacterium]